MKRRSFLQLSAAGTVSLTSQPGELAEKLVASAESHTLEMQDKELHPPEILTILKNEYLQVTLFSDATAAILDHKTGAEWRMGPVAFQDNSPIDVGEVWVRTGRSVCEQYPGRFRGERDGETFRFIVLGRLGKPRGTVRVQVILAGPWVEFRLLEIDENLPSLTFPPPIVSDTLVLPMGVGRWIRKPVEGREYYPFFSRLNMRWFGGTRGQNAWMAVFPERDFEDSGAMLAHLAVSPAWLKSLGKWSEPRVVRYRFLRGGYQELAKCYREWAIQNGLHRSLTVKVEACPALRNLLGGRIVSIMMAEPRHDQRYAEDLLKPVATDDMIGVAPKVFFRHADVQSVLRDLPDIGIKQAQVVLRGWIRGGYDYSHPDVWPPEATLGSEDELRALCEKRGTITVGLHDNYQDIYAHNPSFPVGVNQNAPGELQPGGYWAGGQAYILNSRNSVDYAKRNWGKIGGLHPGAMFIDTTSAVQTYQSYEPGNRQSRSQDIAYKIELLKFFKSMQVVLGSEEGADFAMPYLDWIENRHARVPGESVPLWPLVYHDAAACGRYVQEEGETEGWMGGQVGETAYPQALVDMLWGYFVFTNPQSAAAWPAQKLQQNKTLYVDEWFRTISTAAMTEHHFLTENSAVEETRFSNGRSIVVNFSGEPWSKGSLEVPARSYRILDA
jgi:Family of unknown function (DUF5696)